MSDTPPILQKPTPKPMFRMTSAESPLYHLYPSGDQYLYFKACDQYPDTLFTLTKDGRAGILSTAPGYASKAQNRISYAADSPQARVIRKAIEDRNLASLPSPTPYIYGEQGEMKEITFLPSRYGGFAIMRLYPDHAEIEVKEQGITVASHGSPQWKWVRSVFSRMNLNAA